MGGPANDRDRYTVEAVYARHERWLKRNEKKGLDSPTGSRTGSRMSARSLTARARSTSPRGVHTSDSEAEHRGRQSSASEGNSDAEEALHTNRPYQQVGAAGRTVSTITSLFPPEVNTDFTDRFESRLRLTAERNTDPEIQSVIDRKLSLEEEDQRLREVVLGKKDARREQIFIDHQSVHRRKYLAELGLRGTHFLPLLLVGLFIVKCSDSLKVYHSFDTHRRLLAPMIVRRLRVKQQKMERQVFTNSRLDGNPRPTLEMLRLSGGNPKENFFASWPNADVNFFISLLTPRSYRKGEYIMYTGDMDRVMYIITGGTVEVQIKKRTSLDKRRNTVDAKSFPLPTPTYVGEFALLCREPRGASIQCTTDVDTWFIERGDFESVLANLTPASVYALEEVANSRRKSNMEKFFPIKEEVIRETLGFRHMSDVQLKALVKVMQPHVLRNGTVFINEDEFRPEIVFLTDGHFELTKPSDPTFVPIKFTKGFAYGMRETFFLQESSPFTVKVVDGGVELWLLKRSALDEVGAFFPGSVKEGRVAITEDYSKRFVKSPTAPRYVLNDPFLRHALLPSSIQAMWRDFATPMLCMCGDVLLSEGSNTNYIYFVQCGTVEMRYGGEGSELAARDDEMTADPQQGGTYSGRPLSCTNLAALYPHVIRAEPPKAPLPMAEDVDPNIIMAGSGSSRPRNSVLKQVPPEGSTSASTFTRGPRRHSLCVMLPTYPLGTRLTAQPPGYLHPAAAAVAAAVTNVVAAKKEAAISLPNLPTVKAKGGTTRLTSKLGGEEEIEDKPLTKAGPISQSQPIVAGLGSPHASSPPSPKSYATATAETSFEVGFPLGTFEFTSRRPHCTYTARCLSHCEVWRVDLASFQADLAAKGTPHSIASLPCNEMLSGAWAKRRVDTLMAAPSYIKQHKAEVAAALAKSGRRSSKGLSASAEGQADPDGPLQSLLAGTARHHGSPRSGPGSPHNNLNPLSTSDTFGKSVNGSHNRGAKRK
eukprot:GILI01015448.1.p1 GENE.GILI01015448.1~~GILI01015448.1.p1  ORF type:complete len:1035 (-),score=162.55 GILI01015448.1:94-3063(-)